MVLLVVSLMSVLMLAYFTSMETENKASVAFANTQRAKIVSHGAVAHAVELLRTNIPEPALITESAESAPGENWATNPGRLTIFDDRGNVEHILLHTGEVTEDPSSTDDPNVFSVDLNEPLPGKKYPPIAMGEDTVEGDPPPSMRVRWVDLLSRPDQPASKENQIAARYAFWMDDESARINFNTALGKPGPNDADPEDFHTQLELGMMPPLFTAGDGDTEANAKSRDREWALGTSRSVNLDVLFDDPEALDGNKLLAHSWLRGFSRYPEAILDFVDLPDREREEWYHRSKFQLTPFSRSPEFNAFGRSRFFTTNIPLSLEAGPLAQLPFVYNGPEAPETDYQIEGVLHLGSLLGSLGFTSEINDGRQEGKVHAANIVNRAQVEMLKRYLSREWPGYQGETFFDKYGEAECYQIALNMISMARMATTTMQRGHDYAQSGQARARGREMSRDWSYRSTSTLYSPHSRERPAANPERHYWKFSISEPDGNSSTRPMIPQSPGPHAVEVRLIFQPVKPVMGRPGPTERSIRFRYEVEYLTTDLGPMLFLWDFPAKVDYLRMDVSGGGNAMPAMYELGPRNGEVIRGRPDKNWNYNRTKRIPAPTELDPDRTRRVANKLSLGALQARAGANVKIGPRNYPLIDTRNPTQRVKDRIVVASPWRFLGPQRNWLAHPTDPEPAPDDYPVVLDMLESRNLTIDVKWRLGIGIRSASTRALQMIPLGESDADVLEATFDLDLRSGERKVVSWQINDPRLSSHKDEWIIDTTDGGTPGTPNALGGAPIEPEADSSEKSKFRYFQRGQGVVTHPDTPNGRRFRIDRPDEYNSRSRVASKGYWSMLHTGIQNKVPWRTLNLGGGEDNLLPPDFLVLDLIGSTYPMQHDQWKINSTLPDEFSTVSYMASTAGQINLNSKIYPWDNDFFAAPPRRAPLEAVFKHLRPDSEIDYLLDGIESHQENDFFRYIGELTEIEGYLRDSDATEFQNEELLRNMAGCLTTKSNTFGLWGVSQVVKKLPGNTDWSTFEDGDLVLGEKRFHAVIERYIWPGRDGMPGNAHVNLRGKWDRTADQKQSTDNWDGETTDRLFQLPGSPPLRLPLDDDGNPVGKRLELDATGTYPWFDGPQEVEMDRYAGKALGKVKWTHSSLEEAYNPPQPVVKYRVIYFKYLDE